MIKMAEAVAHRAADILDRHAIEEIAISSEQEQAMMMESVYASDTLDNAWACFNSASARAARMMAIRFSASFGIFARPGFTAPCGLIRRPRSSVASSWGLSRFLCSSGGCSIERLHQSASAEGPHESGWTVAQAEERIRHATEDANPCRRRGGRSVRPGIQSRGRTTPVARGGPVSVGGAGRPSSALH